MQPDEIQTGVVAHQDWTNGELEVLVFDLGGQSFAVEAVLVREILDMMPETRVPGAPALFASVVNFRGKIIPLADLRLAFGIPASDATVDSRIVVIEIMLDGEAVTAGLKTDKVHEVATFAAKSSEDVPVVGLRWRRDFVRALVRHGAGDIVVLPDLHAIFDAITRGEPVAPRSIH
ncbi:MULTISPECIES: chemotaxis protein CheW [unclassified Sphingomonas]|uniref:chemotaxis protein CheW n=1 Tax=unclassified Sphingomonas TaxID=196159 RepID=UPI001F5856DD